MGGEGAGEKSEGEGAWVVRERGKRVRVRGCGW